MEYNELREWLSDIEHKQWIEWSNAVAKDLNEVYHLLTPFIQDNKINEARKIIGTRIFKWQLNWKPYKELSEEVKDMDRVWADKILDEVPFKCPVYQCGGLMIAKERPLPKGKDADDFPDGRIGDEQTPDLICTNCNAKYTLEKTEE